MLALLVWKFKIPDLTRIPARWVFPLAVVGLVAVASWLTDVSASKRGLLAAACSVVIIGAAEAAGGGWFARVLGWRPIRYLGGISYGTYLWHWPVLVLVQRVVDVTPFAAFVLSASLGTTLAALSFELIEQPVRRARQLDLRPRMAIAAGVSLAAVSGLLVAPVVLNNDRPPAVAAPSVGVGVTPVPDLDWAAIKEDIPRIPGCKADDGSDCVAVEGDQGTMMLIGDSHALMQVPIFEEIARAHGLRLVISHAGTCPWPEFAYLGPLDNERTQRCVEQRERVYGTLIPVLDPDIVVMASRGRREDSGLVLGTTRSGLEGLSRQELLIELATATVDQLTAEGRSVVLMEPVVETGDDPLVCLSGAQYVEQCVFPAIFGTAEESLYRSLDDSSDQVVSIDLDPSICPGLVLCPPIIDGVVVRRDDNHLSAAFAASLAGLVDARLVESGMLTAVQG